MIDVLAVLAFLNVGIKLQETTTALKEKEVLLEETTVVLEETTKQLDLKNDFIDALQLTLTDYANTLRRYPKINIPVFIGKIP